MLDRKVTLDKTFLRVRDSIPETPGTTAYDRFRAAVVYTQTGSVSKVAQALRVKSSTVMGWRREGWWQKCTAEIERLLSHKRHLISGRILSTALEKLEDRVKYGEHVHIRDENGTLLVDVRTPLSTKILLDITKTLHAITSKPVEAEEPEEGGATAVNKKLIELAQSCIEVQKKMANVQQKPVLISATEIEDAPND